MSSVPEILDTRPMTLPRLLDKREAGEPIVMVTAYDFPSALAAERAGVDIVLVGDSAANTVLGYDSTVPVSVDELLMLASAVRRGLRTPLLVGDLPFGSYEISDAQAIATAQRFVKEAGCDAVKLEGGGVNAGARPRDRPRRHPRHGPRRPHAADGDGARRLARAGPHGGPRARAGQGRAATCRTRAASRSSSRRSRPRSPRRSCAQHARPGHRDRRGPRASTARCSSSTTCSGSARATARRFVKRYADLLDEMVDGVAAYAADVRSRAYPGPEHAYSVDAEELSAFRARRGGAGRRLMCRGT